MKLSDNFFLSEFLRSDTGTRHNIKEQFNPNKEVIENIKRLAKFLQGFRNYLNSVKKSKKEVGIIISSGYRCNKVNVLVNGSINSFHRLGLASDIFSNEIMTGELFNLLRKYLFDNKIDFDQLIWEFGDKNNPAWVHISIPTLGKLGRKQVFSIGVNKVF